MPTTRHPRLAMHRKAADRPSGSPPAWPGLSACFFALVVAVVFALPLARAADEAPAGEAPGTLQRLPALGLAGDSVTVSGLSSGAYMAGQLGIAYSATVRGAAVLAGGPYGCSRGSMMTAALNCSCATGKQGMSQLGEMFGQGCQVLGAGQYETYSDSALKRNQPRIDAPSNLARQRVFLLSGGADEVVDRRVVDAAEAFYRRHGVPSAQIEHVHLGSAGHGFPVQDAKAGCGLTRQPFINDCDYDAAGSLLRWLYPGLPSTPGRVSAAGFRRFSQEPYTRGGGFDGMDSSGWLYVPAACTSSGAGCRLHVAFHGCEQGQSFRLSDGSRYGRQFVDGAGYNAWAEAGRIVVLYPQVRPNTAGARPGSSYRYNPKGCWDFWGYSSDRVGIDPLVFATREAPQMKAVKAMVDELLRGR